MALSVTQLVHAPPAVVWPHVCEPDRMNVWSEARVELLAGAPCAVGTTRRIHVRGPLGTVRFDEVITVVEPPARFEYRVTRMPLLRRHHGVITLAPEAGGTRVRWDVDLAFWLPGMATLARRIIAPQLARSLERLAATLRS